jgi:hypothetical protein
MTIKMHKVWFDGDNLVTQEIPEEQIYEKGNDMKAKALKLADEVLAKEYAPRLEIAKELRRLHSENEQLKSRQWVGLTEIEIVDIEAEELTSANSETFSFARAVENKLREKNSG